MRIWTEEQKAAHRLRVGRPRDDRGWRIPKDGTTARRVYDLLVAGRSMQEIRAAVGWGADANVRSIQTPAPWNERGLRLRARPDYSLLALPAPPKLLALPSPDWMRALPTKLPWSPPDFYEVGRIKPAPRNSYGGFLKLRIGQDDIVLYETRIYWGVVIGSRRYSFNWPLQFSPAHYYIDADRRRVRMGEMDGEFADEAVGYIDIKAAASFAGVYSGGHRVTQIAHL